MRFIVYCLAVSVASVVLGGGRHVEGLPIDANPEDYALMNFIRNGRELVSIILLMLRIWRCKVMKKRVLNFKLP